MEVVSAIITLGIIVYGYIVTRSLILGAITLIILAILFIAFATSYLQPAIRRKRGQNVNQFIKFESRRYEESEKLVKLRNKLRQAVKGITAGFGESLIGVAIFGFIWRTLGKKVYVSISLISLCLLIGAVLVFIAIRVVNNGR